MDTYSAYKDSGEQWLGQIPAHWEMHKLGHFLSIFSEKGFPNAQLLSVTREQGVILRDKDNKEENHNFVPDDLSGYKHLSKGDFVINKMKSWQGSYGVSEYDGIVSPAYFTCKLKGVYPDFFSRAIRSKAYSDYFMKYSKGIRVDQWDLDPIALKLIPFALPPIEEQEAMVAYLDEQTAQIDSAIAREQKMIDLLEERKQIIIQQAVTKGLNPNAKMKDSGIDWIGEMPEHWDKYKVKHLFKVSRGRVISREELVDSGEFPVYSSQTENNGCLGYLNTYDYDNEILTWTTDGARAGSVFHRIGKFNCTNVCGILCPHKGATEFNIRYVYYSLGRAAFYNRRADILGYKIMSNEMAEIKFTFPPLSEQNEIAEYLDKHIGQINKAIEPYSKMIALLQERKQIIINEVVTGKIKVL